MTDPGAPVSPIERGLAPVRARQRLARAGRWAAAGLLPSAAVAAALAAANLAAGAAVAPWAILAVLAAGPGFGFLFGLAWPASLTRAAAAVDSHYGLKDRAATALTRPADATAWASLQRADAAAHLARVEPAAVVPFRPGRRLALGSLCAAAVIGLALYPAPRRAAAETAGPDADLLTIAAEVEAEIDELEEEAGEEPTPEIEQLIAELREHAERLKEPETDPRKALAELSRMEEAIRQRAGLRRRGRHRESAKPRRRDGGRRSPPPRRRSVEGRRTGQGCRKTRSRQPRRRPPAANAKPPRSGCGKPRKRCPTPDRANSPEPPARWPTA